MAKSNGTLRMVIAIVAALGIPAGGLAGFYTLKADSEWHGKSIEALRVKHEVDLANCEVKFNALKCALDAIANRGASSEAKLDMLVQMVRDMRTKDTR